MSSGRFLVIYNFYKVTCLLKTQNDAKLYRPLLSDNFNIHEGVYGLVHVVNFTIHAF